MVFQTGNGAILEICWCEGGAKPGSQVTAVRFMPRYGSGSKGPEGLRWLLSDRAEIGQTWRAPDTATLQRVSMLIATNGVVVAEYGWGEDRWPGSGFLLGSSWDSSILFWRDQIHEERDLFFLRKW